MTKDFSDIDKSYQCFFYGETPYGGKREQVQSGIDILVGTPAHIEDHLQNGKLDLTKL